MIRLNSPKPLLIGAGALLVVGAASFALLGQAVPGPDQAEAETVPTPPQNDPNVTGPSVRATQAPGPLVPVSSAPEITIVAPEAVSPFAEGDSIAGSATITGGTVQILVLNETVGKVLEETVDVGADGTFRSASAYFRKPPAGSRSVIRVTGTASDGRIVETNREITHR